MTLAGDALVRFDERMSRSAVGAGLIARMHYADAVSSLWVDGELVHMEDLVFHDARMDTRTPTHELTIAHLILRSRRDVAEHPPGWALSEAGLSRLRGREGMDHLRSVASEGTIDTNEPPLTPDSDKAFLAELEIFDAMLKRSSALIAEVDEDRNTARGPHRDAIVYDADWNEAERLKDWQMLLADVEVFPPVLAAAILLDAWQSHEVSEHSPWLGRILAASYLTKRGTAVNHLPALSVGLRAIPRERRHSKSRVERLRAILEAFEHAGRQGLNEHDRLILARGNLERRTKGKRSSSKLPALIDLVLSRPLVSVGLVAKALDISPQGALRLIGELPLRELTGRGRFRAWGIL